ncbi:MAG: hypothetical protein JXQ73_27115 [Phycisphaerae bacterium]|nr:hypothetical protein [Phycisphaerae bacterium]
MTLPLFDTAMPGYDRVKASALRFVEAMKLGEAPWRYRKEPGGGESFYGSYHALHVLDMFGGLGSLSEQERDGWAGYICAHQSEDGLFRAAPQRNRTDSTIDSVEPHWHYTRGHLWALRILDRPPRYPLRFIEPLLDARALYRWVKKYDWANPWAAGNQVLACATALMAVRDWFDAPGVDAVMEQGMLPALEELLDERTGFWGTQFGAGLPNGLFGTIHLTPIYFAQGWPLRAAERNLDSTLACQLDDGSFWPGGSDCPDFDGAYMMANLGELTEYRRDDLSKAARRYLEHALMHESPDGCGWLLHRRDSRPEQWKSRPHWIWRAGEPRVTAEYRDDDPARTHIMLGSWFYPLSIALIARLLRDTGYEGPYRLNPMSLHECNAFSLEPA